VRAQVVNLIDPGSVQAPSQKKDGKLSCKFVVIERDEILHLVLGLVSDFPYHANLVDRFCTANEIPSCWVKKPDLVEVYDNSVSIRGGGYLEITPHKNTVSFSGYSTAYGRYEPADVRLVAETHDFFSDCHVIVPE
jgi:hypothetical protein